jgi:hypothetical protein
LKNAQNTPIDVINVNNKSEPMTVYELSRWLALVEGIDVIDRAAKKWKIDLKKDHKWVKPLAMQKYINERTYGMIADVAINEKL